MGAEAPTLLVLGAGRHQAPLIARAEALGVRTIALDPYDDSPGKRIASISVLGDALDPERAAEVVREHRPDGITTIGTDQPVLVMARVAAEFGLPCHLSEEGALRATNKAAMAPALRAAGVPMPESVTISAGADNDDIDLPSLPCVVKAADSQGQRGMSIVRSVEAMQEAIGRAQQVSRTSTVVVEHFHEGPEFTINAWMNEGRTAHIVLLDRITVNPPPSIGICLQHVYPSVHEPDLDELSDIAERVARGYELRRGPLYIQTIAAEDGYRVIEAASRVGGGHEAQLLPRLMSFDLIDRTIDLALGRPEAAVADTPNAPSGLVNFIVARPGRIDVLSDFDRLVDDGLVDEGAWYIDSGYQQPAVTDSMGRIGYFIVTAPTRALSIERAERAYAALAAYDADGNNLIDWPADEVMNRPAL